MKRLLVALALALTTMAVIGAIAYAGQGNGAPSGAHYNLNVVGVDNPKNADMQDSNRHTIFVPLTGKCNIQLTSGDTFAVLDGNCFSGGTNVHDNQLNAEFQLPPPDPDGTGTLQYTVFVKVPTPNGSANMQTCFTDSSGTYCNSGMMLDLSKANYPKFTNVSKNLLTVCAYVDDKWQLEPLFADSLATYFWNYDNNGLRLAQLRFYPNTPDTSPYANMQCTVGSPR